MSTAFWGVMACGVIGTDVSETSAASVLRVEGRVRK